MENLKSILSNLPRVSNMLSSQGNIIPNQFIIRTNNAAIFQSYRTIIAIKADGQTILDINYWDYSATTGKYRNDFLNENIAATRINIKNKVYKLADLNK